MKLTDAETIEFLTSQNERLTRNNKKLKEQWDVMAKIMLAVGEQIIKARIATSSLTEGQFKKLFDERKEAKVEAES